MSLRRVVILVAVACVVALVPSLGLAKTYRSLEVKHEFQRQHPCQSTGRPTGACPGTSKITSCRSPAADPTRSPTCNGRPVPLRRRKIAGSGRVVLANSAWTKSILNGCRSYYWAWVGLPPQPTAAVVISVLIFGGVAGLAYSEQKPGECGYYTNSNGHQVPRPCGNSKTDAPPTNATAICRDGSYSFSEHPFASGTCSHHGGIESHLPR
jgi:hypothetical protein